MTRKSEIGSPYSCALQTQNRNHIFVSNIRFWSMFAIIAVHSLLAWGIHEESRLGWEVQVGLLQTAKFGTIAFYLISGFLLGERLHRYTAVEYLLRRLKNIGIPWAIWVTLYILFPFAKAALVGKTAGRVVFQQHVCNVLLSSPYWFVPNYLIALAVILKFRHRLDDYRCGAVLLIISLFYGVNIYAKWIPSNHTSAVFGFVFYLWLGNWASRHLERVSLFLDRLPVITLLLVMIFAGTLALGEAHLLSSLRVENILNTLRLSNQLFSIVVVLGLMKLRRRCWPSFVDPRAHTFGLYLVHPVCMFGLIRLFDLVFRFVAHSQPGSLLENYSPFWSRPLSAVGMWGAMFVVAFGTSLAIVRALSHSVYGWMIAQPMTVVDAPGSSASFSRNVDLKRAA